MPVSSSSYFIRPSKKNNMFHVRVFQKKEEEGLFIFYFLIFLNGRHLRFPTILGVFPVKRNVKTKRDNCFKHKNWTYLQCFNSVAPCLARTEHIYSVLMVLAPCLARTEHIYSVLMVLAPCLARTEHIYSVLLVTSVTVSTMFLQELNIWCFNSVSAMLSKNWTYIFTVF